MSEAMQAVMKYGIEHVGLKQFRAITEAQNSGSIRLLKKQNYQFKKILSDEEKVGIAKDREVHIYVHFSSHSKNS